MAYQRKLEFNLLAVIYTILENPILYNVYSTNFSLEDREMLEKMAESPKLIGGNAATKMRRILRDNIEKKVETRNFYIDKMAELKMNEFYQKEKERFEKELQAQMFSIKIVGSGTKQEIADELRRWTAVIECTLLKDLRDGIEHEEPNTILKTDLPKSYKGEL